MLIATGEPDNLIVHAQGLDQRRLELQLPRDAAQSVRMMAGHRARRGRSSRSPLRRSSTSRSCARRTAARERPRPRRRAGRVRGPPQRAPGAGPSLQPEAGRGRRRHRRRRAPPRRARRQRITFGRRDWTVVGVFDAGGTAFDSEIWADVTDVQDDTRRPGYSAVRLTIAPGADRRSLVQRIEADGRFTLEAKPEQAYYREQADTANALYVLVLTLAGGHGDRRDVRRRSTRCMPPSRAGRRRSARCGRSGSAAAPSSCRSSPSRCCSPCSVSPRASCWRCWRCFAVNTLLSGVAFSMMTFTVATVLLKPSLGGVLLGVGLRRWASASSAASPRPGAPRTFASSTRSTARDGEPSPTSCTGEPRGAASRADVARDAATRRRLPLVLAAVARPAGRGIGRTVARRVARAAGRGRDRDRPRAGRTGCRCSRAPATWSAPTATSRSASGWPAASTATSSRRAIG